MRCKYCGSDSIHPSTQHKSFSTGKAIAGSVVFGVHGAAAGFIGKDVSGYTCNACGQFMDSPMDLASEIIINNAVSDAETGRSVSMYEYLKKQYININANISHSTNEVTPLVQVSDDHTEPSDGNTEKIKHRYRNRVWYPSSPIKIEEILIKETENGDAISILATNTCDRTLRSAYFKLKIFDDVGDLINEKQIAFQGVSVAPKEHFPLSSEFILDTNYAYHVDLQFEKGAAEDGTIFRNNENEKPIILDDQILLTDKNFKRLKYVRKAVGNITSLNEMSDLYLPIKKETFWQCICGNTIFGNGSCAICGGDYNTLQQLLSQKNLKAVQEKAVKDRAAARAAQMQEILGEVRRQKEIEQEKLIEERYAAALNQLHYSSLNSDVALKQLKNAKNSFDSLGDYKDANDCSIQCDNLIEAINNLKLINNQSNVYYEEISDYNSQLKNLGIFSGGKKKQLQEKINANEQKISANKEKLREVSKEVGVRFGSERVPYDLK